MIFSAANARRRRVGLSFSYAILGLRSVDWAWASLAVSIQERRGCLHVHAI
ncbi:hypothetical protein PAHAL_2G211400 [Panicum hallii]|uniref:Uncharacterized protein n=1 Tax=Panicum hallii TaxID=206008 RepID=A0A2T8KPS1_9POAL|nr:hypothetical protein PAHAL_2G211400 [Panicum hallii]